MVGNPRDPWTGSGKTDHRPPILLNAADDRLSRRRRRNLPMRNAAPSTPTYELGIESPKKETRVPAIGKLLALLVQRAQSWRLCPRARRNHEAIETVCSASERRRHPHDKITLRDRDTRGAKRVIPAFCADLPRAVRPRARSSRCARMSAGIMPSTSRSVRSWAETTGAVALDLPPPPNINQPGDLVRLSR